MNVGSGPEDLPQFEDRFLYHLIDIAGDKPMGQVDGVPESKIASRLAIELGVTESSLEGDNYLRSEAHSVVLGAIEELEIEGMLTVPLKETGEWDLRPTRDGRRRVAEWREKWEKRRASQDREVQRLILRELEQQWRADPETYKITSRLDVEDLCNKNDMEYDVYLINAHRLIEQGKIEKQRFDEAGPDNGFMYITESGRRDLEAAATTKRPQPRAEEAWVEVARLKRRLQIAERDLPSLISDDELRERCEDLLSANAHYDRVIREACVVLEDRVRNTIGAGRSLFGTSLMNRAFGAESGLLKLSDEKQEQLGAMHVYRGVIAFFRNATGHNLIDTYDQQDALRFVVFVDLLLSMVGKASRQ